MLYYAILRAGGTVVNFNPLYAVTEVVELVRTSETKILATLDIERLWDKAIAAQQATALEHVTACRMTEILPFVKSLLFPILHYGELVKVTDAPAVVRFADLIDNDGAPEPVAIDPQRDVAVLQFTGDTTGTPKAAMLTHANVTANAWQLRLTAPELRDGDERFLGLLPLCHAFAMTVVMTSRSAWAG